MSVFGNNFLEETDVVLLHKTDKLHSYPYEADKVKTVTGASAGWWERNLSEQKTTLFIFYFIDDVYILKDLFTAI